MASEMPICPSTLEHGKDRCPRSDVYRAIESGDTWNVWGWLFRCRTCKNMFFRASKEAARSGLAAAQAQKQNRR